MQTPEEILEAIRRRPPEDKGKIRREVGENEPEREWARKSDRAAFSISRKNLACRPGRSGTRCCCSDCQDCSCCDSTRARS